MNRHNQIRGGRRFVAVACLALFSGCASIDRFYVANPDARGRSFVDCVGPVKAEPAADFDRERLLDERLAEDYYPIGSADFTGAADEDWTGAMERLGAELKAGKIDYFSRYLRTDSGVDVMPVPVTQHTWATAWGPRGPHPMDLTTTTTAMVPYSYNIPQNEFHVFYFKKLRDPSPFGIECGVPGDELAKEVGTRNAMVVNRVIRGKIAWKNDIFKGDVILEADGRRPTEENMRNFCADPVGKSLKILRSGKTLDLVIR